MEYAKSVENFVKNINEISHFTILWKDADESLRSRYGAGARAHLHPYCMGVKARGPMRCLNEGKCAVDTHGDDALPHTWCCFAGVQEYRYPIVQGGRLIGMIVVTGGRSRKKPLSGLEASYDTLLPWNLKQAKAAAEVAAAGIRSLLPLRDFGALASPLNAAEHAVDAIVNQLRESPRADWRVSDMAYAHGLSESRVVHVMRERYEATFQQLRTDFVMQQAKRYLRREKMTQEDIALALGFCNAAYFSQAFKRYIGLSPKVFRRECEPDEA